MNSKKGTSVNSTVVSLLVLVVAIIALFAVITSFASDSDKATQHTLCRSSVIVREKATLNIVEGVVKVEKITPLVCKTEDLGMLDSDREAAKKEIADKLANCWWQFAEGSSKDTFMVDKGEKGCFVCYVFNIDKELDKGVKSHTDVMGEEEVDKRTGDKISFQEMNNYLFSENYDPGIIYGGGTKNYFGALYKYDINAGVGDDPDVLKQSKLNSGSINGFVMDYARRMDEQTKLKIDEIGSQLQAKNAGNLLVLTAEEFKSMENSDARAIIENTNLNTNESTYDGLLFMLDYKKMTIRVHVGSDLSAYIAEYKIQDILDKEFTKAKEKQKDCPDDATYTCSTNAINEATLNSITQISDILLGKASALDGVSPKSYYYYISNAGTSWPLMDDITADKTYAIVYVGVSDEISSFSRILAKSSNLINKVNPLQLIYYAGDAPTTEDRPQLLMITDVNSLGNECAVAK